MQLVSAYRIFSMYLFSVEEILGDPAIINVHYMGPAVQEASHSTSSTDVDLGMLN